MRLECNFTWKCKRCWKKC